MNIKYICPNCKMQLNKVDNIYVCKSNHCFDIAKEGYVNLLLASNKKSKDPGDNEIMIKAREEFLSAGYFDNLANELAKLINSLNLENIKILDAGCGTGYYLRKIIQCLHNNNNIAFNGIDISKHAIKIASKKDGAGTYAVASIFDLPFEQNSFNVILNIFAPKPQNEFERVLETNGYILEVIPASNHLKEIREILFENIKDENKQVKEFQNFRQLSTQNLTYQISINNNQDILNLLKMTPYFYKSNPEKIAKFNDIQNLNVTLDFTIKVWKI